MNSSDGSNVGVYLCNFVSARSTLPYEVCELKLAIPRILMLDFQLPTLMHILGPHLGFVFGFRHSVETHEALPPPPS